MYESDHRIVLTLDAGGTNLSFNAVQAGKEILDPVNLSARVNSLEEILKRIIDGFKEVKSQLADTPVAISFAFPGPANYDLGIIGDLPNLSAFRGGVALGPFLQEVFHLLLE